MADPTQVNATSVRTVGLVASHRSWRSEFARYVQDHITGLRVRVLRDPRAIDETIDVVIIDDSSTFLNRESLRQLHDAGVAGESTELFLPRSEMRAGAGGQPRL